MAHDPESVEQLSQRRSELRTQIAELEQLRNQLEKEVEAIREGTGSAEAIRAHAVAQVLGRVAHHFSNLIQVVMAGAHLALTNLEMENFAEARSNLEQVLDMSRAGAQTVRYLQDYAKEPREGATRLGKIFDLSRTVDQAVEMSKSLWAAYPGEPGPKISVERMLGQGCFIKGRENEIFEAVTNLIKNAVAALPHGGQIKVETLVQGDSVIVRVQDDGIGIAPENQRKVFEPFWTSKSFRATGMGLTISFGIFRRHQGQISLESREHEGSTVTVRLPLARGTAEETEAVIRKSMARTLNMLVIDDMRPVMWVLRDELTKLGQTVLTASSGPEGLDLFKAVKIDAVICDLGMPEMNGWEVGRAVKQLCNEWGVPKIPFILLTGWGGQIDEVDKVRDCGIDRIVEKPAEVTALLEIVRELVPESISNP